MMEPRLIALLGAECTGKTTLAQALAQRLGVGWVPEYLRDFCDAQGRTPRQDEQAHIVQRQMQLELDALAHARQQGQAWVICDTTPLMTAVYSDFVFGDTALYPFARASQQRYALTVLLAPAIPWVADGIQRDSEAARTRIHATLLQECAHHPQWHTLHLPVPDVENVEMVVQVLNQIGK